MDKLNKNWQKFNLEQNISKSDFEQMLNDAPIDNNQKSQIISIFDKLAGDDNILSNEEWENFIQETNTNKDESISKKELQNIGNKKFKDFVNKSKDAIYNFFNMINSMVTHNAFQPENSSRSSSVTDGSFTENWLMQDEYNSETYEDWIKNNNYTYNEELANKLVNNISKKGVNQKRYRYHCSAAVTDTTQSTSNGTTRTVFKGERQQYAYQNASEYAENPNFKELPHNIVSTMDLANLPAGCIIVYDAGYANRGEHKSGHIGITDGKGNDLSWGEFKISDGKQTSHIRVFVPIKIKEEQ